MKTIACFVLCIAALSAQTPPASVPAPAPLDIRIHLSADLAGACEAVRAQSHIPVTDPVTGVQKDGPDPFPTCEALLNAMLRDTGERADAQGKVQRRPPGLLVQMLMFHPSPTVKAAIDAEQAKAKERADKAAASKKALIDALK